MSDKSTSIFRACSWCIAAFCILLFSCAAPFEKEVTKWLSKNDSLYIELTDVSLLEKMTEEQAQVYYETRIEEERLRLLEQYKLRSCEPCAIGRFNQRVRYTIADLKAESIDSVLFSGRSFLCDSSGAYQCDISLFEKKALLDSANQGLIRKNEVTIDYLRRMLYMKPSFYHLEATYLEKNNKKFSCYLVARTSANDTLLTKTELPLFEFLSPHKFPFPQFEKKNERLVPAIKKDMGPSGGGLSILKQKPKNRAIAKNDWIPWDSITFYEFDQKYLPGETEWIHDGIFAAVDTTQVIPFRDGDQNRPAYPIFIYNLTDQTSSFSLFYTQQAKDSLGNWRAIEGVNGIPYEGTPAFFIKPEQVGVVKVQVYAGEYKTKLRTKLVAEFGNGTPFVFFTNEYSGTINYGQFTPPQGWLANSALEDKHWPWFAKYWQNKHRKSLDYCAKNRSLIRNLISFF